MKKLFVLMLVGGTVAILNSCNQPESCEGVVCENGGICLDGACDCPDGFSGPNCQTVDSIPNSTTFLDGVFIVHEGNFGGGTASLSYFNKATDVLTNGVFSAVNGIPLGDVGQSMTIIGDKGYIVVNNSGKIEVVNLNDLSSVATITGLTSPRYIAVISSSKAYVSDLFGGQITVFDPQTYVTQQTIAIAGQVEEMVVTPSGVIAAGTGAHKVYKINSSTDALSDSVDVGLNPTNLAVDANGKVWILTNSWGTELAKLVRIDPADMSVELSLDFSTTTNFPSSLKTNAAGTTLFWADGGVFKMDITANALPSSAYVSTAAYKLGVDPENDMLYVSDAIDFNQNGKVYRYTSTGAPIDTFSVGVIPGEFCFTE